MNALPYYKRFSRRALEGTAGLPFEIKCGYLTLLDIFHLQGGVLADHEAGQRYIAGQLGCSVRKWNAIKTELLRLGKIQIKDGQLFNNLMCEIIEEQELYLQTKSRNGARSKDYPKIISRLSKDYSAENTDIANKIKALKNRAGGEIKNIDKEKKLKIKNSIEEIGNTDERWLSFRAAVCRFASEEAFTAWVNFRSISEIDVDARVLVAASPFIHQRLTGGDEIAVALRRAGWQLERKTNGLQTRH